MTAASLHPQYDTGHPLAGGCFGVGKFGDRSCRVRVYSGPLCRRSPGGRRRRFCLYVEPRYEAAEYLSNRLKSGISAPFVHVPNLLAGMKNGERTEGYENAPHG